MCGRFTLTVDLGDLAKSFPDVTVPQGAETVSPRYNIAPTQPVAVVPNTEERMLDFFVWGLIPFWAKDPKIGNKMINARSETAAEKPAFRAAYQRRRCLVIADGFYEWMKEPGQSRKTPMYIQLDSGEPFGFAGLWERWQSEHGDEVLSCTILTTQPNEFMKPIHNRMPVILPRDHHDEWMQTGEVEKGALDHLLVPFDPDRLKAYPVSTIVNSPANDVPQCVEPVPQQGNLFN